MVVLDKAKTLYILSIQVYIMIDISLQAVAQTSEQSTFRGVIDFFHVLGIYDVILPFLLIFTVFFAILEKTKVFGTEKVGDTVYTKKNLNAMTAFIVSFFVVASTRLVAVINEFLANVVLLLLLIVMFLVLVGSFYRESEDVFLGGRWRAWFMAIILIVIILIFFHAIPTNGSNWLEVGWVWIVNNWNTNVIASIILLIVIVIIMALITKEKKAPKKKEEGSESK